MLIRVDRVCETSTTTGTGALTLAGAVSGYRAFSAAMSVGDTCYYAVEAIDASGVPTGEWETGLGTYSGANTLTRTTIHSSSNANAAVSFAAGTKRVIMTMTAAALAALVDGTAPVYRTSAIQSSSAASFTVNFPSGTAIGDRAVLLCGSGLAFSRPAGWVELDNSAGTNFNGAVFTRVLSAADITAGSVTVAHAGTFNAVIGIVVFEGAPDVRLPVAAERSSAGATSDSLTTDGGPRAGDMAILFGATRAAVTVACADGTQRQVINATNASGVINTYDVTGSGDFTGDFTYSSSGTGYYEAIVILRGSAVTASADWQPYDADLAAIAGIVTTSTGRDLLTAANPAAIRSKAELGNVDNTADNDKNVLSATKLTTARTIGISGAVTGTATSFDGTANITITITAMDMGSATAGTLAVARGGTGVTTSTGTGNTVRSVSPTFTGTTHFGALKATSGASGLVGSGPEFSFDGTQGILISYNRTGTVYLPMYVEGSTLTFNVNGTGPAITCSATKQVAFPGVSTTASAANAFLDSGASNQLLRSTSSLRYKRNVEDIAAPYVDAMMSLRPVWYRSKAAADNPDWGWWGLVAEEVAEIDPRLVHWGYHDDDYEDVPIEEDVQVTERKTVPVERIDVIDGRAVRVCCEEEQPVPVFDYLPLVDSSGEPIMDGDEQAVHAVPRMIRKQVRTERRLKEGAVLRPDGVQYERLTVLLLAQMQRTQAR